MKKKDRYGIFRNDRVEVTKPGQYYGKRGVVLEIHFGTHRPPYKVGLDIGINEYFEFAELDRLD